MIKITLYDKDGNEKDKPLMQKGFRPILGFFRLPNGNFEKWEEDPRCISDKLKIKEEKEKKEKEERDKKWKRFEQDNPQYSQHTYQGGYTVIYAQKRISCKEAKEYFRDYTFMWRDKDEYLVSPIRCEKTGFTQIDLHKNFSFVCIDKKNGDIQLWVNTGLAHKPDIIVRNVLKSENTTTDIIPFKKADSLTTK